MKLFQLYNSIYYRYPVWFSRGKTNCKYPRSMHNSREILVFKIGIPFPDICPSLQTGSGLSGSHTFCISHLHLYQLPMLLVIRQDKLVLQSWCNKTIELYIKRNLYDCFQAACYLYRASKRQDPDLGSQTFLRKNPGHF